VKARTTIILLDTKTITRLTGAMMVSATLSACGTVPATVPPAVPPAKVQHKSDPPPDMSGKVQSLEKQIQERDKRIQDLEAQLDALKLIDQEHEKQRKPLRPPTTLEPAQ
jgi:hypothetical protein